MAKPPAYFIGSEIYRGSSYGAHHPLRIPRVSTVIDLGRALGWFGKGQYLTSPRAKPAALRAFHTADYLSALQRAEADGDLPPEDRKRFNLGTPSNPIYPEVWRRPATAAGGSLLGAELLLNGPAHVHSPGGGTHHGLPDQASGFCYLNDCVLALKALRRGGMRRLAYIDIDAHHADGVQSAFGDDPDVLLISVHEEGRWPRTGHLEETGGGALYNLPVPRGLNDTEMEHIRTTLAAPALDQFAPEAIILQCGADAVAEDPQARLALSNTALWRWVAMVRDLSPRVLLLGGGGYNPWTVGRAWTGAWATLAEYPIPERLPTAAREILRDITWSQRSTKVPPAPYLMETLADAPRPGPIRTVVAERVAHLARRLR
ncbi:MAG: acetoin utilization protein AcuC [Shimia sp.]